MSHWKPKGQVAGQEWEGCRFGGLGERTPKPEVHRVPKGMEGAQIGTHSAKAQAELALQGGNMDKILCSLPSGAVKHIGVLCPLCGCKSGLLPPASPTP